MNRVINFLLVMVGVGFFTGCIGALHLSHQKEILMACISYPETLSTEECVVDFIDSVPLQAELPVFWETVMDREITQDDSYWVLAQDAELDFVECAWGICREAVALVREYNDGLPVVSVLQYLREVRTTDGVIFIYTQEGQVAVHVPDQDNLAILQLLEDNAPVAPPSIVLQVYK